MTTCTRCKTRRAKTTGLCSACYQYRRKTGRERPASLFKLEVKRRGEKRVMRPCSNCGMAAKLLRELCRRCYDYQTRFNKARPERLWKQVPRPPRIIKRKDKKLCECGQVTTRGIRVTIGISGTGRTTIWVCDDCCKLEFS